MAYLDAQLKVKLKTKYDINALAFSRTIVAIFGGNLPVAPDVDDALLSQRRDPRGLVVDCWYFLSL